MMGGGNRAGLMMMPQQQDGLQAGRRSWEEPNARIKTRRGRRESQMSEGVRQAMPSGTVATGFVDAVKARRDGKG
ncbi:hypothetical protein VTH06DRAFT_1085 [Thermothelomyces fergusii]